MNSAKKVAPSSPPIMTIASGRCDSEPIPWLMAAGISPIAAIEAVITTGRTRERTLSFTASGKRNLSRILCLPVGGIKLAHI